METFEQFANRWKNTILPLKKPATQSTLGSHIRFLNEKLGSRSLPDIAYNEVQAMFSELAKDQMPRSIKNLHGTYRLLLSHAVKEGLLEEYPKPILPKIKRTPQDWLKLEEMKAAIKAANDKYKPFVALLCEAGPRIGEAVGIRAEDLTDQTLYIQRSIFIGTDQDPKTDNAVRKLYVSGQLRDLLKSCGSSGYLFHTRSGSPWWPTEIRKYTDSLLRSLNIKPVGFHSFRRGCATALASTFACPEKILGVRLGHSNHGLTLGTYAQAIDGADKPYIDAYAKELYA